MILLLVITCFIVLTTLLYKHHKASKTLLPPAPSGLPLIGNLHQLCVASSLHLYLWQLSEKYGPLMHLKLGSTLAIVVSSEKLGKEALKTHDSSFCSRAKHTGQRKLSYNQLGIAFAPYRDHWREMRKITSIHLFSPMKLQSFCPIRQDEICRMIKRVSTSACLGRAMNLRKMATKLFSRLICRVAFGKRSKRRRFDELIREAEAMMIAFLLSDYFPMFEWVDKLFGLIGQLETTFVKMDAFYQELIDERLDPRRERKACEDNDIIDVLIKLKENESCSSDLSWDCIKALLMVSLKKTSLARVTFRHQH